MSFTKLANTIIEKPDQLKKIIFGYELQSADIVAAPTASEDVVSASERVQIIRFDDSQMATPYDMGRFMDNTFSIDEDATAKLGEYLSRPVKIASWNWTEGLPFSQSSDPWTSFFTNQFISRKLDFYSRIRCNLKLKFVLNSSPFYYGAIYVYYQPMNQGVTYSTAADLIPISQLPGVWLEPQKMTSVEMTLPFLWTGSWLNVSKATDVAGMGQIRAIDFSGLRSANGVTGTDITISVFAWAEEVTLAGPTYGESLQGDEYEKEGTVSGPASTVGNIAAMLSTAPIIGPFAMATSIGANAVASIAKIFGYSNPPMIDDVMPYQPKSFHAFANTETRMPIDRLCIDPKNEVTIDNSIVNVDPKDSLTFENTVLRESFYGRKLINSTYVPGDVVFTTLVSPGQHNTELVGANNIKTMVPCAYFGEMFNLWRGTMKYKIKIVKSQYHRGRIAVSWDPEYNIMLAPDPETSVFTKIIDLEYEDEVIIEVPFKAKTPYLKFRSERLSNENKTPDLTLNSLYHNGILSVRVLNVITGPAADPEIELLFFSNPGKDFRFAMPKAIPATLAAGPVQSGDLTDESEAFDTKIDMITTGESICSLRPLLHRTSYHSTHSFGQYKKSGGYMPPGDQFTTNVLPRFPKGYGFSSYGLNWADSALVPASKKFNYCANHPLRWVTNCFLGYRGSTNLHINPISNKTDINFLDSVAISRYYDTEILNSTLQNVNRFTVTNTFGNESTRNRIAVTFTSSTVPRKSTGQSGMSLTNTRTQSALSVNVPQYIWTKFMLSNEIATRTTFTGGDEIFDNVEVNSTFSTTIDGSAEQPWPFFDLYYAAGVDFNPLFFLCTPRLYSIGTPNADDSYVPLAL
jgi:hypothetical protein